MNNELTIINEQEVLGKQFKVYGTFEQPLFLAKDVAEWIDYSFKDSRKIHRDVSKMLGTVDEEEKVKHSLKLGGEDYSHGGIRENTEYWFLTEDGLYEVLMQSRKPIAKSFKKEVKKILKEIRTKGSYNVQPTTPQLSPMQLCAVTIFDNSASEFERLVALQDFQKFSIETGIEQGKTLGMKKLCDNGVVTIATIMSYIKDTYSDRFVYSCDIISTEWSRYLKHMGYLETKHFKRKDGKGMESKWSFQPTKLFDDVFLEQGMAIVREIDDRGKLEITYTLEIERFLLSELFEKSFFEYLDKIYPRLDVEEVA